MKNGIVYCYTNKINGKKYVGQTIHPEQRKRNHLHSAFKRDDGYIFHDALRKHGIENFDYRVLEECNESALSEREAHYIKEMNALMPHGYNMLPSSNVMDEATRKKISNTKKGTTLTEEHKRKIGESQIGKKQPDSQKQKVAAALSEKWIVTHPDGREEEIINLNAFCKLHKLSSGNFATWGHTKGFRARKVSA